MKTTVTYGPDCASCGQMTRTIEGDDGAGWCEDCAVVTDLDGRERRYDQQGNRAEEGVPFVAYVAAFVIPLIGLLTAIYLFARSELGPAVAVLLTTALGTGVWLTAVALGAL